jgi:hypothetical protein
MVRTRTHKLIKRYDNRPDELFDLTTSENEGRNILLDGEGADIAADLSEILERHFAGLGCAPPDAAEFNQETRFNAAEAWR